MKIARGFLLLGSFLLLYGLTEAWWAWRLDRGGTRADGVVEWHARRFLLVNVTGVTGGVVVRDPWWSLPGRYARGKPVRIVYDPAVVAARPFMGGRGRIDSFAALWLSPLLLLVLGGLLILLDRAERQGRGVRTTLRLGREDD